MLDMMEKLLNNKYSVTAPELPLPPGKPAIIFVHGAGGSHMMWLGQLAYFKKDFNPMAVDLPGHALSPEPACMAVKDYADFVLGAADALGLDKFFLVGLSMGGAISQYIALHSPGRLLGLVLMSTGARLKVMPEIFKMIRENWEAYLKLFPTFAFGKNAPPAVVEQSLKELAKCEPKSAECDFMACDAFNVQEEVKNIKTPTLIISAADDRLTPPKYSDFLHSQIDGSQLVRISDAGHIVNLEKPNEVNHALRDFFRSLLEKK